MSCDSDCTTLVSIPGPRGPTGPAGAAATDGLTATTTVTAAFEMPACDASVAVEVESSEGLAIGSVVYVESAGYFRLLSRLDATHLWLQNLCITGNATSATIIPPAGLVSPSGEPGTDGVDGTSGTNGAAGQAGVDGVSAWTQTVAGFVQPAVLDTVALTVLSSAWMTVGEPLFIQGGGMYVITAIAGPGTITVQNLGGTANTAPAATITSGKLVTPSGFPGTAGVDGAAGTQYAQLTDTVLTGEAAQLITYGAWTQKRLQATNNPDSLVMSLAANRFVLVAGDYIVAAHVYVQQCYARLRLFNVTTGFSLVDGVQTNTFPDAGQFVPLNGRFTVGASQTLELQYYAVNNGGGAGLALGFPMSTGAAEIYASVDLLKIVVASGGGGGGGGGQVLAYTNPAGPNVEGLLPADTSQPATAYDINGVGDTYYWNFNTLVWQ